MVFFTDDQYAKQFHIVDVETATWTSPTAFWTFKFANFDEESITASNVIPHPSGVGTLITFVIPPNFFQADRAGPLTHQVKIRDSDNDPVLHDVIHRDELRVAHKES